MKDITGLRLKVGDRIRLLEMPEDPLPIEVGSTGTVKTVTHDDDPSGTFDQAWVEWDDKTRSLALVGVDRFEIIGTVGSEW